MHISFANVQALVLFYIIFWTKSECNACKVLLIQFASLVYVRDKIAMSKANILLNCGKCDNYLINLLDQKWNVIC